MSCTGYMVVLRAMGRGLCFGGEAMVRSLCRWQGQLIFTKGHSEGQLFSPLFDKDEQLQWSNFKGSGIRLTHLTPVQSEKNT